MYGNNAILSDNLNQLLMDSKNYISHKYNSKGFNLMTIMTYGALCTLFITFMIGLAFAIHNPNYRKAILEMQVLLATASCLIAVLATLLDLHTSHSKVEKQIANVYSVSKFSGQYLNKYSSKNLEALLKEIDINHLNKKYELNFSDKLIPVFSLIITFSDKMFGANKLPPRIYNILMLISFCLCIYVIILAVYIYFKNNSNNAKRVRFLIASIYEALETMAS